MHGEGEETRKILYRERRLDVGTLSICAVEYVSRQSCLLLPTQIAGERTHTSMRSHKELPGATNLLGTYLKAVNVYYYPPHFLLSLPFLTVLFVEVCVILCCRNKWN